MKTNQHHTEPPRIYVACLAAYNNGILHGAWIEAVDAWSMWEATRDMLAKSPIPDAEEWAIHDYEGFASIRISEYASFERVAELAGFIKWRINHIEPRKSGCYARFGRERWVQKIDRFLHTLLHSPFGSPDLSFIYNAIFQSIRDLKSADLGLAGSTPAARTIFGRI